MRRATQKVLAVSCASLTTAALVLGGGNARASDEVPTSTSSSITDPVPDGFSTWGELFETQNRMNAALENIRTIADALPGSGFGSAVAAPEKGELVIYWAGPVPAAVQAAVNRAQEQVPVVIRPARYTEAELLLETERLGKHQDVVEVGPLPDASGLMIRTRQGLAASMVDEIISSAQVSVVHGGESAGAAPFSRKNDSSPWFAGAWNIFRQWYPYGGGCTTGFAVYHGGTTKLLSAAHCGADGDGFWDGNSDFIGYAQLSNTSRDVQLINARGAGRTWDGGVISNYSKAVQSVSQSTVGNWLCTSGSRTGIRCDIQTKAINVSFGGVYPLVKAERSDHTAATGTRDSGGPVFSLPYPDNGKVIAKGIINSGDTTTQVACVGENWSGRICTWRFYYADVAQTLAYYGATIVTG